MTTPLLFATTNKNKVQELQAILGAGVTGVSLELLEIQSVDIRDVIEAKARHAFEIAKAPVLVEDTSLSFEAWNGLPGALVKWFLETVGCDGLCRMLGDADRRGAMASTLLGFFDGENFHSFSGELPGAIARKPLGDNGFGWDAIFIPDGSSRTLAELAPEVKNLISMRKIAAEKLRAFLQNNSL